MEEKLFLFIQNNNDVSDIQRKYIKQVIVTTSDMSDENRKMLFDELMHAKKDYQIKFGMSALAFTENYDEEDRVRIASSIMNTERYDQASQAMRLLLRSDLYQLENSAEYIEAICTSNSAPGSLYAAALTERAVFLGVDVALPLVQQVAQKDYKVLEKHLTKMIQK